LSDPGTDKIPDGTLLPTESDVSRRIERAVGRARLNLLWESVWPVAAPFATLAGLFLALSWFGVWRLTSTPIRYAMLAAFAAAVLYCVTRLHAFRLPTRPEAFGRVEQATGSAHRPATAFADRLATAPGDPTTEALWLAHRRRLLATLDRLRSGIPTPGLARRDPYALRFLVLLLFAVGFVVAGPERLDRLGEAFRGGESIAATVARIDAWVTPPAYTGRPPIFLTGEAAKPAGAEYSVPTGSIVTVRTGGTPDLRVVASGDGGNTLLAPVAAKNEAPGNAAPVTTEAIPPLEHRVTLTSAASVIVKKGDREISSWRFTVEADNPPSIALVGDPKTTASGALHLIYSLEDDYGVVAAFGEIKPVTAESAPGAHPLYDAPTLPLALPQLRTRKGNGETTRDLTAHPWAGSRVKLTLVARDEAGQEGRSTPVEITLPARQFTNELARAVVEQRTKLALDANAAPTVADALDALTLAPDTGIDNFGNYLLVRSAYYRLVASHDDDDLRGVVDYLWTIAQGLEDGDRSLAAQQLRAAEDALQQALQNNASDEEIAQLTQQLRDSMQKFTQALAAQAARNPQAANLPPNSNVQTLRPEDLQKMLDQIENLAKTGARDAARQLLSQLQNMMENLQAGQPQAGSQAQQQAMQQLNQLGDMIRRQEQLMNRTFSAQRGQNGQGQPMTKQEMDQALQDLQSGQQALSDQLGRLMQDMQGSGVQPNGKLGQAGEAMGRAAQALGKGAAGAAVGEQSSALDALRQGAQGLAQQFATGTGPGGSGFRSSDDGFSNNDPLGRPMPSSGADLGSSVKVPDAIDTQRAREILDAIRQRLGASSVPAFERDYLERLLEQF
jgi:uncharacterized protein (TIGR02302 family)